MLGAGRTPLDSTWTVLPEGWPAVVPQPQEALT